MLFTFQTLHVLVFPYFGYSTEILQEALRILVSHAKQMYTYTVHFEATSSPGQQYNSHHTTPVTKPSSIVQTELLISNIPVQRSQYQIFSKQNL